MALKYNIFFDGGLHRPYIHIQRDYVCEHNGGYIEFIGKYWLKEDNNEWTRGLTLSLPTREIMFIKEADNLTNNYDTYYIEIYKKELIEHHDGCGEMDDEHLGRISVSFSPLEHMRLYFRIIHKEPTAEQIDEFKSTMTDDD